MLSYCKCLYTAGQTRGRKGRNTPKMTKFLPVYTSGRNEFTYILPKSKTSPKIEQNFSLFYFNDFIAPKQCIWFHFKWEIMWNCFADTIANCLLMQSFEISLWKLVLCCFIFHLKIMNIVLLTVFQGVKMDLADLKKWS